MAFRLYIVPEQSIILQGEPARFPKYFSPFPWNGFYYGFQPIYLVASDLAPADDAAIVANADVFAFPFNLTPTVGGGNVQAARNALEAALIPAQWVSGTTTWRQVARMVAGMFQFMQRLWALLGDVVLIDSSTKLNVQFSSLPANVQAAILQAAADLGYSTANIQANTQVRAILQDMGAQWGTKEFHFGGFTL